MSIARKVDQFLHVSRIPFELTDHARTATARQSAKAAHVRTSQMAKAVVVKTKKDQRYFLAVIPAGHRLKWAWLKEDFSLDATLASEQDLAGLFPDCAPGAVPPFGTAYQLPTIWDDSLDRQSEVYLEAGDHEHLVRLDHESFHHLFEDQPHSVISSRG